VTEHVLVTGGAGYIGGTLVEGLLNEGSKVTVLDRCFFGTAHLDDLLNQFRGQLQLVKADIRSVGSQVFEGVTSVCDLAALSNDPSGDLDPIVTYSINHLGRMRVAMMARERGVRRYVLASSCSIYGFNSRDVHEGSRPNPLTAYAKANYRAERDALLMGDKNFCVTILRQATVYGLSPGRMRFDLAVNAMARTAYEKGVIYVDGDGMQWRPFVHVRDTARVFREVLRTDPKQVEGQVFNVGSQEQNCQIRGLAEAISSELGDVPIEHRPENADDRSYNVDFQKIEHDLGFRPEYTPEKAAQEIYQALESRELVEDSSWDTIDHYVYLLKGNPRLFEPMEGVETISDLSGSMES
jgi:nucleoside-diphosphate-sugar epimerase